MKQILDSILKTEVQNFIQSHENGDVHKLLLKHKTLHGVPMEWIAHQINGRQKTKIKLPKWHHKKGIVFPPSINLEQSSSEATAKFKLSLLQSLASSVHEMGRAADLTGGLGVDTFYLSQHAKFIDYVEPDETLLDLAKHNHARLGVSNIVYHHSSAETFLKNSTEEFDFIFADPSRRKASQKVYRLADCDPDVVSLQTLMHQKSIHTLTKTSPLLDLQQGKKELNHVIQMIVVAVENECKELLFLTQKNFEGEPTIRAVDLDRHGEIVHSISFTTEEEKNASVSYSSPLHYLYEPDAAILKAGAFKWVGQHYHLKKLAANTHLYTSDEKISFQGRIFKVSGVAKSDKKLKGEFHEGYANIISRNYPLSVEEIKKKTGLKEGGNRYLICTQTQTGKLMLIAERVK